MKILLRDLNGEVKDIDVNQDMTFDILAGDQFYVTGASSYDMQLINGGSDILLVLKDNEGESYKIILTNMGTIISENSLDIGDTQNTTLFVSTTIETDEQIESIVTDDIFNSGEIIEELLSLNNENGAFIYDFVTLSDSLEASAANNEGFTLAYSDGKLTSQDKEEPDTKYNDRVFDKEDGIVLARRF